MKKLVLFLSLLFATTHAYARYKHLFCDNKYDAYSCSNSCKSDGMDYELKFKIDKSKNIVIESQFLKNKLIGQTIGKNCKVINEENWTCEDESSTETANPKFPIHITTSVMGMNDGNYFNLYEDNLSGGKFNRSSCSKRSLY